MEHVKSSLFTDEQLNQHRLWVESHGSAGTRLVIDPDQLYYENFDGLDLSYVEFKAREMKGCSFKGTNLEGVIIGSVLNHKRCVIGCDFTDANLSMAHLENCVFRWSNFTSADFRGAFLAGAFFTDCEMDEYPKGIPSQEEYMNANFSPVVRDGEHLGWMGYVISDNSNSTFSKTEMSCVGDRRELLPIEDPGITVYTLERCNRHLPGYRYSNKVWRCFIPKTASLCVPYGYDGYVFVSHIEPWNIISDPFAIRADSGDIEHIIQSLREIATGDERW